jgi:hypothetical protein
MIRITAALKNPRCNRVQTMLPMLTVLTRRRMSYGTSSVGAVFRAGPCLLAPQLGRDTLSWQL